MKFPYGISDFNALITEGYYYCDRTDRIPDLEEAGKYLLFIRPRRFGKSLLLSTLKNYYDINQKDRFGTLFGDLNIGQSPTPLCNQYFILQWDFSCIDHIGDTDHIRKSLHDHINSCIRSFILEYDEYHLPEIHIDESNSLISMRSLLASVKKTGSRLYLLIDEYDNFANEVMMNVHYETSDKSTYRRLVGQEGILKVLFKAVKAATGAGEIDRVFITGVSPVVLSDITSGFNIAENIYLNQDFNDLCGFTESEVEQALEAISKKCGWDEKEREAAMNMMRTYYNGYIFSDESEERIFNPTMAIYFMKYAGKFCKYPRKMLDANLATDEGKLVYIAQIPKGRQLLLDITRGKEPPAITDIIDRFGIKEMLSDNSKKHDFLASFLYYFGVLTIAGITVEGELILSVPNLVMRGLYVDRIKDMLLPDPAHQDDGQNAAKKLYTKGDMAPVCEFIEQHYFSVFHNPDYKWANELTVKTAFLTLLYNDIMYIMDSERETGRGYADLTMIIRPDMRKYRLLDVLIEFKYVKLGKAGVTGEEAKKLSVDELQAIPAMKEQMEDARGQVEWYGDELEKKHGNLRLKRFAVVSLGFERLWWEKVEIVP